jgi:cytochrome b6-f complex iron-sulfur subunit
VFGLPAAATVIDPALRRGGGAWRDAGAADALTPGEATPLSYEVAAGFETQRRRAFLVKRDDGSVDAFDARCTHFGCTVRFRDGAFRCPCHGGRFAIDGAPAGGPVTEPLRRIETTIENGRIRIRT